ncbi:MAG: PBSX family phage terminase large subunit, partial [Rhodospirillales bacterium]|nr:PBSX family phage terminase large subunit [Rhodospirillales bacterium]
KILYGGRGGAKSWGVSRLLIMQAINRPIRVLCAREFQNSIGDSVHKLLSDQIKDMGADSQFVIEKASIRSSSGAEFFFAGIRNNVNRIKSFEGIDVVWVEEAQTVSKASWEVLIPTIRKPESEIWVTFNPGLETDETYKRFVLSPPSNSIVLKIDWRDNPWFPDVLRAEMEDLKAKDEDAWLNVWEGHCRRTLDGAIYAKELRRLEQEARITTVPYEPSKPVHTFWDLGFADCTAIWLAQLVGLETRIIGYIEAAQQPLTYYVQALQALPYVWGTDWLPHDARAKQLGTGKSIEEMLRGMGRTVRITPQLSVTDGINAARTMLQTCWIDAERCADGLQRLRHYRYDVDPVTQQFSSKPLHDDASHGADAFRYLAVALRAAPEHKPFDPTPPAQAWSMGQSVGLGWMR